MENRYLQEIPKYKKRKLNNRYTNKKHEHDFIPIGYNCFLTKNLSINLKCRICGKNNYKIISLNETLEKFNINDLIEFDNLIKINNIYFKKIERERRNNK